MQHSDRGSQFHLARLWQLLPGSRRAAVQGRSLQEAPRGKAVWSCRRKVSRRRARKCNVRELLRPLRCELLARCRFTSQTKARMVVFSYIEGWYNPGRRRSALSYLSPNAYENQLKPRT